jgi:hypothetical protein
MHGRMVNRNAAHGHHLFKMAQLSGYATYYRTQSKLTSSG